MNKEQFLEKWEKAKPEIEALAHRVRSRMPLEIPGRLDTGEHRMALNQAQNQAIVICKKHGLEMFVDGNYLSMLYDDAEALADYWFRSAQFAAKCQPEVTAETYDESQTTALIRINAPAWFKREDFLEWLNREGTASWHRPSHGREAGDYSDAFFTYCQGEGSDYPGSADDAGIPDDIWNHLGFLVAEKFSWDAEVLVWVSNLE